LFDIFDVHLPVLYGEKKQKAHGRLLQEIVARSGYITARCSKNHSRGIVEVVEALGERVFPSRNLGPNLGVKGELHDV